MQGYSSHIETCSVLMWRIIALETLGAMWGYLNSLPNIFPSPPPAKKP